MVLDHAAPWMLKLIIDHPTAERAFLWRMLAALALAIIVSGVLGYLQRAYSADLSRDVEAKLRSRLFARVILQPKSFFAKVSPGDLLQNLVQDLDRVQELVGPAVLHFYRTGMTLVISTAMLYLLSPTLAGLGFAFFVTLSFASLRLMRLVYTGYRRTQKAQGEMGGFLRDVLHGITVLKASGAEEYFKNRYATESDKVRSLSQRMAFMSSVIWPAIILLCGLGVAAALCWGSMLVQQGRLSAGALAAAILYLVRAQYPLVGLGIMAAVVQRGRVSLDRVRELDASLAGSLEQLDVDEASKPEPFARLEFRSLAFRYGDGPLVLEDLNMSLLPGRSIGIVGETGSGKSTLAKIACGALPTEPGMVFCNGADFHGIQAAEPHGAWRGWFGYAPQDGFLFSWTIAENIGVGARSPANGEIASAAERAGLGNDLSLFADGLSSLLGEKGINLSGGQRQRVGLARAFLSGAPVLVLDDVLSAVDPETERKVVQVIQGSKTKHALLIVSHRYSTLTHCDEILYLERGRVVERGTHAELLKLDGRYAKSWRTQMLVEESP